MNIREKLLHKAYSKKLYLSGTLTIIHPKEYSQIQQELNQLYEWQSKVIWQKIYEYPKLPLVLSEDLCIFAEYSEIYVDYD